MHALALYMNHVVKREHIQPYERDPVAKVGLGDDGNGWKAVAYEHIQKAELQDVLRTLAVLIRSVDVDDMPDLALSKGEAIQRDSVSVLYGHEQMRLYPFSSSLSLQYICCSISFHCLTGPCIYLSPVASPSYILPLLQLHRTNGALLLSCDGNPR